MGNGGNFEGVTVCLRRKAALRVKHTDQVPEGHKAVGTALTVPMAQPIVTMVHES